jgi:hypothetical protein
MGEDRTKETPTRSISSTDRRFALCCFSEMGALSFAFHPRFQVRTTETEEEEEEEEEKKKWVNSFSPAF